MPHFVIDCSAKILSIHKEIEINQQVHQVAYLSGLFAEHEIKVRINPFTSFLVGNQSEDFIHVFAHIMEGRTSEQKAELSKSIVRKLSVMFPDVVNIAMNVNDFEKATYINKAML
ncbi:5-carboxymethyl-2-hydroxymuconate Delta-isomerase [Thalassotalea piscium]